MSVSRSSYYDRFERDSVTSPQSEASQKIITAFLLHKRRYGTRRLVSELADEGILAGRQTVRTVLADHELRAIQPKSFVPKTTQTHPNLRRRPNLLLEGETTLVSDEVYVGDITYLPLVNGKFAFLATFQDVFTKNIVGWDIADHMREELVLNALEQEPTLPTVLIFSLKPSQSRLSRRTQHQTTRHLRPLIQHLRPVLRTKPQRLFQLRRS